MSVTITKHAYKRARQRMGLCKKAFKRMVDQDKLHSDFELVIVDDIVITVKNIFGNTRAYKRKLSRNGRKEALKGM